MNAETIGTAAGQIWQVLNDADAMGAKQLKAVTKLKDKELFAAVGWLAREDKIVINQDPENPKEYIFSLVPQH